jgi:peptide deformylase
MTDIVQRDHPVLRKVATDVSIAKIGSPEIKKILADMKTALDSQNDGIAIAAPQINVPLRIFIVSGSLLKEADATYTGDGSDLIFINPSITKLSREKDLVEEGCLSVRWMYGKVPRSIKATLRAYNEKGEKVERGASGLLAQIFQHEVDHLDGILFTDKADELWEMSEEEIKETQRK